MPSPQEQAIRDHQEWINTLQPDGLVVSARALFEAQVLLDQAKLRELQERYRGVVVEEREGEEPRLRSDVVPILRDFLQWPAELVDGWGERPLPPELAGTGATPGARFALRAREPKEGESPWLLLVQTLADGEKLDVETELPDSSWKTTPSRRFERLLNETKVPIGLIADQTSVRLIYTPAQQATGTLTFPLAFMAGNEGRKILGGFHTLFARERLFTGPRESRLPALLERSRKAQAAVSTQLAEQVLESLYDLVRGFQSADARTQGALLGDVLASHPDHVYQGLLNVLLRLITLLYAEDRGLLPQSDLFVRNYSLRGLYERLRADHERYADTMDGRFGAWHQLLVLFRCVYTGCQHPLLKMPARHGGLFDPERFGFLEGRTLAEPVLPLVPDGTVYRVLRNLLVVDGERLSYRWLDVEHIGSVYETMMGFRMERATGPSIALKATKKGGAPATIDLAALLEVAPAKRAAWIKEHADQKIDGKALEALKAATTLDGLRAALDRRVAHAATPDIVAQGSMVLQPSDERRRSGSHYTPRSLTEPIVRKTLEPLFARLGPVATAEQILDLRVCDPAMGSGAFLVEACRQLAQRTRKAWEEHHLVPAVPPDEDLDLYAMRMVAQRCLYGVDKNPAAVDLAKLSLWLATFAREHAFTFLDHAFKCGDSLVGSSREQFLAFHWDGAKPAAFVSPSIAKRVGESVALRDRIRASPDQGDHNELRRLHEKAQEATSALRMVGDLVLAVYFSADSDTKREAARHDIEDKVRHALEAGVLEEALRARVAALHKGIVAPFHWWLEFPEVFASAGSTFDAICGNPPFLGGTKISGALGKRYLQWLQAQYPKCGDRTDLVAYFARQAFFLLAKDGCMGMIATKTVAEGDTRKSGLGEIVNAGGKIYYARRRLTWPGSAAVVVAVVCIAKGGLSYTLELDGNPVSMITRFLLATGADKEPTALLGSQGFTFEGFKLAGKGFLFSDRETDRTDGATPLAMLGDCLKENARTAEVVWPYLGGEDVTESPECRGDRYAIFFAERSMEEVRNWPQILEIVRANVRPWREARMGTYRKEWWLYGRSRPELTALLARASPVYVIARATKYCAFAKVEARQVFNEKLVVLPNGTEGMFSVLQSRIHEVWAIFFSATTGETLQYTPTDCFETFAFPPECNANAALQDIGKAYHEFRAELMLRSKEGLTKTYNRFHSDDPRLLTPDIVKLRELHAAMDRAVLDAYPELRDIQPNCEFLPDYFEEDDDGHEVPKSIRYRWPDEIRDEVLARLLALNQKRHEEEVHLGLHAQPKSKGGKRGRRKATAQAEFFEGDART